MNRNYTFLVSIVDGKDSWANTMSFRRNWRWRRDSFLSFYSRWPTAKTSSRSADGRSGLINNPGVRVKNKVQGDGPTCDGRCSGGESMQARPAVLDGGDTNSSSGQKTNQKKEQNQQGHERTDERTRKRRRGRCGRLADGRGARTATAEPLDVRRSRGTAWRGRVAADWSLRPGSRPQPRATDQSATDSAPFPSLPSPGRGRRLRHGARLVSGGIRNEARRGSLCPPSLLTWKCSKKTTRPDVRPAKAHKRAIDGQNLRRKTKKENQRQQNTPPFRISCPSRDFNETHKNTWKLDNLVCSKTKGLKNYLWILKIEARYR